MTPEEKTALIDKMVARLNELDDLELAGLAKELGVAEEEAAIGEDADKVASKVLADQVMAGPATVDTGVLTGDRGGLKNFLIKKSRDKDMEAKS